MNQENLPFHKFKVYLLLITLVVVIIDNLWNWDIKFTDKFLEIKLLNWLLGYLITISIAFLLHYLVYAKSINIIGDKAKKWTLIDCILFCSKELKKKFSLFIFSSDYVFAKNFKSIICESIIKDTCPMRNSGDGFHLYNDEQVVCKDNPFIGKFGCEVHLRKTSRKLYVLLSNWANVILVCCLIIATASFISPELDNSNIKEIYYAFLIFHTMSRVIEISFAFYQDVVVSRMNHNLEIGERLSNLKRGNRISLAVHSYIEIALIFSIIYYLQPSLTNVSKDGTLLDYILYSFSVMAYNFSFSNDFTTFGKFIHLNQIFVSITLVVLSIANYLGLKDEMSQYEKADWKKRKYI